MNISLNGNGYAQIDSSLNPTNLSDVQMRMTNLLNTMKQLDNNQIINATNTLIDRYRNVNANFVEFMDEWQQLLDKVAL
nr:MAG TPA: hypothetical protein [Caudoviricetes sp.]